MSEIFNEIEEDIRRDRLKKLWDKYSIFLVAGAFAIVVSVGGWRIYDHFEMKNSIAVGAEFDKAVELAEANKHAEAEAAFVKVAAGASGGYRELARLRAAAEAGAVDPQAGVKAFDLIIKDTGAATSVQELARVRAAALLVDTSPYDAMLARLETAAAPGAVYRHTARELLALSAWRATDAASTRRWTDMIIADAETPPSLRSRAEALQALLPPAAKS